MNISNNARTYATKYSAVHKKIIFVQ